MSFSPGDRCGDGQGRQGPLRAVGHMGREDGVLAGDAEQPRWRERHWGQTENRLPNPQSQRGVEEELATVSTVPTERGVRKSQSCTHFINVRSVWGEWCTHDIVFAVLAYIVIVPICSGFSEHKELYLLQYNELTSHFHIGKAKNKLCCILLLNYIYVIRQASNKTWTQIQVQVS